MGSCQSGDSVVISIKPPHSHTKTAAHNNVYSEKPFGDPDYGLSKFNDMPEWPAGKYRGVGIKQMKGFKCTMPIDELQNLREEFWNFKIKENVIWKSIRQACLMDECKLYIYIKKTQDRSNSILSQLKLATAEGVINHLIDENGKHYFIPNFCINDPYFEKELLNPDTSLEEKKLNLILYDSFTNQAVNVEILNVATGRDLKTKFCSATKSNFYEYKIRVFFAGMEILDEHKLFQHKLKDDFKIQVMKRKIETES